MFVIFVVPCCVGSGDGEVEDVLMVRVGCLVKFNELDVTFPSSSGADGGCPIVVEAFTGAEESSTDRWVVGDVTSLVEGTEDVVL